MPIDLNHPPEGQFTFICNVTYKGKEYGQAVVASIDEPKAITKPKLDSLFNALYRLLEKDTNG